MHYVLMPYSILNAHPTDKLGSFRTEKDHRWTNNHFTRIQESEYNFDEKLQQKKDNKRNH